MYDIGTPVKVSWTSREYYHKHMKEFQEFLESDPICFIGDPSEDSRPNIAKAMTWTGYIYVKFAKAFRDSQGILDVPGVVVSKLKIKGV